MPLTPEQIHERRLAALPVPTFLYLEELRERLNAEFCTYSLVLILGTQSEGFQLLAPPIIRQRLEDEHAERVSQRTTRKED